MYLVDTSAWIEVFRKGSRVTVDTLVDDRDQIVTCPPVIQEVLQGFDDERAFRIARTALLALPCVELPVTLPLIEQAVDIYRRARRAGVTVRSGVDCVIAACASRHNLTVVHRDRDFAHIARVLALQHVDIARL
ncbi:MAG TPA: PIN domain-containing protein [Vicinamibacterales bacterium]